MRHLFFAAITVFVLIVSSPSPAVAGTSPAPEADEKLVALGEKIYLGVVQGKFSKKPVRRNREKVTFAQALAKAPEKLQKQWRERLAELAEGDEAKKKIREKRAVKEVMERAKKHAARYVFQILDIVDRIKKNRSKMRDPKIKAKFQKLQITVEPMMYAIFGKKRDPNHRMMVVKKLLLKYTEKKNRKRAGELVEIMRAQMKASNESRAIGALRTIVTSQQQFRVLKKAKNKDGRPRFARSFQELIKVQYISKGFADGKRLGYQFTMTVNKDGDKFSLVAVPLDKQSGTRSFYTDQSGRVTFTKDGSIPTAKSPGVN